MTLKRKIDSTFRATRRRLIGRLLPLVTGGRRNLSNLDVTALPARVTMPLRRDGLDPVALVPPGDEAGSVLNIGRVLGMTLWLVTGYDEAKAVLADPSYSTDIRALMGGRHDGSAIGGLGFTDPPDHTALRRILMPEFTARRLAALRPAIERIVEDRLDAMEAAGPISDLVADFAFSVPFEVICELLGLPVTDRERFQRLGHERFDVNKGGAGIFGAISESRQFMLEAVGRQRLHPGTGLIASMLRTHGDQTDDVIAGLADGVFTGGYETSASMIGLGVLALTRDPAAMARIRADETAVDGVVDELLRYLSVVQIAFPRFARQDLMLSGHQVRAGDVVICSLSRANRDDVFGQAPGRFDALRPPHQHLAFGHGFHRCVGAELARIQLRVAFRALVRRFPTMELAVSEADLQFHDLSIVYGLKALPLRLHSTAACRSAPPTTA